jgi:hypothetical protein
MLGVRPPAVKMSRDPFLIAEMVGEKGDYAHPSKEDVKKKYLPSAPITTGGLWAVLAKNEPYCWRTVR